MVTLGQTLAIRSLGVSEKYHEKDLPAGRAFLTQLNEHNQRRAQTGGRMLYIAPDDRVHLGSHPNHDASHHAKIAVEDVSFWYGPKQALKRASLQIYANEVTALMGPSGCGKTTLLRCLNRTNEIVEGTRMEGRILLDGADIYAADVDPPLVRRRFGWIAQRPNPFTSSIRANVAYGPEIHGLVAHRRDADALVEASLQAVGLWQEVKDRLNDPGIELSIGQQQRLCIARAFATRPDILLMDEPCSALDPVATALIENLIDALKADYTIVIITHNLQQAARVAQRAAFFHLGEIIEVGDVEQLFPRPKTQRCQDFITGRYG
jgi:phosphate transport system ATP-binding protein